MWKKHVNTNTFSVQVYNMLAFIAKQENGHTLLHSDEHEGMQTSSLCYLMDMKKKHAIFDDAPMPLCLVRNGHKGQN